MAFGNKRRKQNSPSSTQIDTLLGPQTVVEGSIKFSGGLHIDGVVKGNVVSADDSKSSCHISPKGHVVGELRVANVHINGAIDGDVYSTGLVELAENARINGNVYYRLIDVAVGAQVNGQLVYCEPGGEAGNARPQPADIESPSDSDTQAA